MDRALRSGVAGGWLAIACVLASCAVRPGVNVTQGFEPERDYSDYRSFQVKASEVGPPLIQARVAETLAIVLVEKGLTRANKPDLLFTLDWSAEDATCPWFIQSSSGDAPCKSTGGSFTRIRAQMMLEGKETATGTLMWRAEIGAVRTIPLESPSAAEIQAIFLPVFRKALQDFPVPSAD